MKKQLPASAVPSRTPLTDRAAQLAHLQLQLLVATRTPTPHAICALTGACPGCA